MVEGVDGGDDHDAGLLLGDHAVEVGLLVGGQAGAAELGNAVVGGVHACLVRVAEPDEGGDVAVVGDDAAVVEGGADAAADDGVAFALDGAHVGVIGCGSCWESLTEEFWDGVGADLG